MDVRAVEPSSSMLHSLVRFFDSLKTVGRGDDDDERNSRRRIGEALWCGSSSQSGALMKATRGGRSFVASSRMSGETVDDDDDAWALFAEGEEAEAITMRECWRAYRATTEGLVTNTVQSILHSPSDAETPSATPCSSSEEWELARRLAAHQNGRELLVYPCRLWLSKGVLATGEHIISSCHAAVERALELRNVKRSREEADPPQQSTSDIFSAFTAVSPCLEGYWDAMLSELLLAPSRIMSKCFLVFEHVVTAAIELLQTSIFLLRPTDSRFSSQLLGMIRSWKVDALLIFLAAGGAEAHWLFFVATLRRVLHGLRKELNDVKRIVRVRSALSMAVLEESLAHLLNWLEGPCELLPTAQLASAIQLSRQLKQDVFPYLQKDFLGISGAAPGLQQERLSELRRKVAFSGSDAGSLAATCVEAPTMIMLLAVGGEHNVSEACELLRSSAWMTQSLWRLRWLASTHAAPTVLASTRLMDAVDRLLEVRTHDDQLPPWVSPDPRERNAIAAFVAMFGSLSNTGLTPPTFTMLRPEMMRLLGESLVRVVDDMVALDDLMTYDTNTGSRQLSLMELLHTASHDRFGTFVVGVALLHHRIAAELVEPLRSQFSNGVTRILFGDPKAQPTEALFEASAYDTVRDLVELVLPVEFDAASVRRTFEFLVTFRDDWCDVAKDDMNRLAEAKWISRVLRVVLCGVVQAIASRVAALRRLRDESGVDPNDEAPLCSSDDVAILGELLRVVERITTLPTFPVAILHDLSEVTPQKALDDDGIEPQSLGWDGESSPWVAPSSVPVAFSDIINGEKQLITHDAPQPSLVDRGHPAPSADAEIPFAAAEPRVTLGGSVSHGDRPMPPPLRHRFDVFLTEPSVADQWIVFLPTILDLVWTGHLAEPPLAMLQIPSHSNAPRKVSVMRPRNSDDEWHGEVGKHIAKVLRSLIGTEINADFQSRSTSVYQVQCASRLVQWITSDATALPMAAKVGMWREMFEDGAMEMELSSLPTVLSLPLGGVQPLCEAEAAAVSEQCGKLLGSLSEWLLEGCS